MRIETRTVYIANDGQEFATGNEAERYEVKLELAKFFYSLPIGIRHDFDPEGLAAALVGRPSNAAALAALLLKVE
jgi:hypothetical protein